MDLRRALADVVGDRHALDDPELTAPYETDWTGRFGGRAAVVVRPADADEVAEVVRVCASAGAAVVPQGGNTGLVGGGVPRGGEVLLSLRRLDWVGEVDAASGQISVGAGATLAALRAACAGVAPPAAASRAPRDTAAPPRDAAAPPRDAAPPVDAGLDFAARDSCTVGGIVACDAGGARALRHGTARARVAGLEAVLADGSRVSRMSGLLKDNAGFALPHLLIGSEGTLGIITAVRWRTVPLLPARVAALVGLPDAAAAARLLAELRATAPGLEACEFLTHDALALALDHQQREAPIAEAPLYVLAECAAREDPTDELALALERAGFADTAVIADDTHSREGLWRLREGLPDAIAAAGVPHKLDVGVPLSALGDLLEAVPGRAICFGHLGDGNVHVNLLGLDPDDTAPDDAVLETVLSLGGTISAEHGIGVAKRDWLERARGSDEVAAMRAVKAALDPRGLLNPGAVLP